MEQRKKAFVDFIKPGIEFANRKIQDTRTRLEALQAASNLTEDDQLFIAKVAHVFQVPIPNQGLDSYWYEHVLKRVDIIPIDLVLAQSAIESGWGASRFARLGNNYFGQWCYSKGCGMVPKARAPGRSNEVAVYHDPYDSIHAYFINVNTDEAYKDLRQIRKRLRIWGQPLTGEKMVEGLKTYSQRGQSYVDEVLKVMKSNQEYWSL